MSHKIIFLCQHGGAKSVIAATYFNNAGLPYTAVAASTEDPYDAVPQPVADLLGLRDFTPRQVTPEDVQHAARIIAIDCEFEGAERWDDVPPASEDLEGSAAAIRRHIDALIAELRG